MDINSLRSFVLFSEYGTLNKVADAQHRTNAAISAQMKKLSNIYDIKLFEKQGRNLTLSADGIKFLDVARCILSFHDKIIGNIKESDTVITIKIGIPSDYAGEYLLKIIKHLSDSLEKIKFELLIKPSKELYELWQNNELDITIYSNKNNDKEGSLIAESQGHWFGSKHYCPKKMGIVEIALFDETCVFHQKAVQGLIKKETHYKIHSMTSDARIICNLVENFNIITAMSSISTTDKMVIVNDSRLPKLPKIFIKLLLSKKLELIDVKTLISVIKPLTQSAESMPHQPSAPAQKIEEV